MLKMNLLRVLSTTPHRNRKQNISTRTLLRKFLKIPGGLKRRVSRQANPLKQKPTMLPMVSRSKYMFNISISPVKIWWLTLQLLNLLHSILIIRDSNTKYLIQKAAVGMPTTFQLQHQHPHVTILVSLTPSQYNPLTRQRERFPPVH